MREGKKGKRKERKEAKEEAKKKMGRIKEGKDPQIYIYMQNGQLDSSFQYVSYLLLKFHCLFIFIVYLCEST